MSEIIQVDIVTPEKKIFSESSVLSVNAPGIEGDLEVLCNHIPIITFLKPGKIQIEVEGSSKSFFISDGVLEFNNNVLTILVSEIFDTKEISETTLDYLKNKSQEKIKKENQTDNETYISERFQEEVNQLTSVK